MKGIINENNVQDFHCFNCGCNFRSDEYIKDNSLSDLTIIKDICPKCCATNYKFFKKGY